MKIVKMETYEIIYIINQKRCLRRRIKICLIEVNFMKEQKKKNKKMKNEKMMSS